MASIRFFVPLDCKYTSAAGSAQEIKPNAAPLKQVTHLLEAVALHAVLIDSRQRNAATILWLG